MANSIRYDWVACVIDGVTARRVQTLGSSTDFSEEKLLEIGDQGSVSLEAGLYLRRFLSGSLI